jgi:hypothetical protein
MVYTTIEFMHVFLKAVAYQDLNTLISMLPMEGQQNTKQLTDMLINAMISAIECDLWDVYHLLDINLPHLASLAFLQSGVENYKKTFKFLLPLMPKEIVVATMDLKLKTLN